MQSIRYNKHIEEFKGAKDVKDTKRIYKKVYFKNTPMTEKDIKGAKIIDFEAIYEFIKQS